MESSTQKRALGLKDKIPDIQKTLDTVQFLKSRDVRSDPFLFSHRQTPPCSSHNSKHSIRGVVYLYFNS